MRTVFAGPCGVGKTAVARLLAAQMEEVVHLDFDEIRTNDIAKRRGQPSPCSVSFLDLEKCLPPILDAQGAGFILDIGGDTIFRSVANNEERLKQVRWLKASYQTLIVVFLADRDVLYRRFITSKGRTLEEFGPVWDDWCTVGEPYWRLCADRVVDTTLFQDVDQWLATLRRILE